MGFEDCSTRIMLIKRVVCVIKYEIKTCIDVSDLLKLVELFQAFSFCSFVLKVVMLHLVLVVHYWIDALVVSPLQRNSMLEKKAFLS